MTILYVVLALVANMVIGAGVWAAIDEKDGRFFRWYKEAPCIWAQLLVLSLWPVALVVKWREGRR